MSDEASRKRADEIRKQIEALRRGEKPKPGSIRDAVAEAAKKAREEAREKAREEAESSREGGEGDRGK